MGEGELYMKIMYVFNLNHKLDRDREVVIGKS